MDGGYGGHNQPVRATATSGAVVSRSPRPIVAHDPLEERVAALEAAGIAENEPGGGGRPVALDPDGAKEVSAPGRLTGTRGSFDGDVRSLNCKKPHDRGVRPEKGQPEPGIATSAKDPAGQLAAPSAPSPAPSAVFNGLDYASAGNGYPPDTNGDVGPSYFVQSVNTSIGIFSKTSPTTDHLIKWFPFNGFIQGTRTLCDTNNYGDPVVVYDSFTDRWIISDFAFTTDASGNVTSDNYQCFAVSKTGDPVSGGWWFYAFKVGSFAYPSCTGGVGTVPANPAGLTATAVSRSQINLAWGDVATETGYKVERSSNRTSAWAQIATTAADTPAYTNTGLPRLTTYYYRVRATNAAGDSPYSAIASATTARK